MSDLTGSQVYPPHGRVHLCFSPVMDHGQSTKSKHSHERLYSTTSLKTSELQKQGLSSLQLADTFLMFFYLLFITFPFPKSKMLASANSEPHENLISQFKCLVTFYTAGYEQCNFMDLRCAQHKAILMLTELLETPVM